MERDFMDRQKLISAWLLLPVCLVCLAGCGWWGAQSDNGAEEDFADLADDTSSAGSAASQPVVAEAKSGRDLKVGDRFPLLKTVTHTLQQASPNGWVTSRSTLEMLMTVTIEEIHQPDRQHPELDPRSGQKRLQVNYLRLHYLQELPGQPRVEYDSMAPVHPVPQAALGYHGLKDNGFGFWLGPDNQIVELVAFDQFLKRCLNDVPADKRQEVGAALAIPAAEAIASFVDDTVGILPSTAIHEGDTWMCDRQVLQPVPLHINSRFTLRQIASDVADIDVLGTISAPVPHGSLNQPNREVRVVIRGGRSQGHCRLDRRTGLPVESRIEQALEMTVRMPDGSEFEQHKQTLTTIRLVLDRDSPGTSAGEGAAPSAVPARLAQENGEGRGVSGNNGPRR
jgi:hypothetical protein